MTSSPLRVGILGAAKIAPRALIMPAQRRSDVEVTVIAARDPDRARVFADAHRIAHVAESYQALIQRDDIDLVYVALPAGSHAEWTIKALDAGKAVLCEKPFAMNLAQAQAMVEASARNGRPLFEALHYRHHPVMLKAIALVQSGALGELQSLEAVFDVPIAYGETELRWQKALGGGSLMDLGTYCLHAVRMLAQSEPTVLSASAMILHGVDAALEATLAFTGGVTAKISSSMVPSHMSAQLTAIGSRGRLDITNFIAPQIGCRSALTVDGKVEELPIDPIATFEAQLEHVVQVMRGQCRPIVGGSDSLAHMGLIDEIYRQTGQF